MTEPLVSIVTAVRNGAEFLIEAIESVREQTVAEWEHVIVDDASEDHTATLVERASTKDPRIRLVQRNEQGGPYAAANDGLRVARGTYIARIDADDLAPAGRLETQLRFLAEHPHFRACGGFHRVIDDGGALSDWTGKPPVEPGVLRWRLTIAGGPLHSTAFIERSALDEIGGYAPLPLAQDWRLWCELSRRGWLGIVPEVVAYRRVHPARLTDHFESLQFRFALDVARDHLAALTGRVWPLSDVRTLLNIAREDPVPFLAGVWTLERWAQAWRADKSLTSDERRRLERWTTRLRRRHIRKAVSGRPISARVVPRVERLYVALREAMDRATERRRPNQRRPAGTVPD